ncbi:hypothetical protein [Sphingobacterium sp. SYP-B4668]|uniref:hypothetical protein n=1 Tax=Sphingobacterium sp. SYP-B4668 TaxID=2996035 RepID=UPI0022DE585B|nr:hypothetical protein [Sphingobacterium sp. SYP-B4668]
MNNHTHQSTKRFVYGFQIAEHYCTITMPRNNVVENCLPSFGAFLSHNIPVRDPILTIDLQLDSILPEVTNVKLLNNQSIAWGDRFRFEEWEQGYITSIQSEGGLKQWKMFSSKDFKVSTIYGVEKELENTNILSWLFMVAFGQAALIHHTLLVHASVVQIGRNAVAFLGKSGTGKSTHSKLWCNYIENCSLLNDDNPAIRIKEDGTTWIYGTPWSGKTACYKQEKARLVGAVRLEQAAKNYWTPSTPKLSLLWLMPSFSALRWNSILFESMLSSLELIIKDVNVGKLSCKPDEEAVRISYKHAFDKENITGADIDVKNLPFVYSVK